MKKMSFLLIGAAVLIFIFVAIRSAEKEAVVGTPPPPETEAVAQPEPVPEGRPSVAEAPAPSPALDEVAATEPAAVPSPVEEPPPPERPAVNMDPLTLAGTDCAVELVTAWAEAFTNATSNIAFSVRGNLPEDVPLDLVHGRAHLGMMDRSMTDKERLVTEEEYGIPATAYRVAGTSEQHPAGIWMYAIKEERYRLENKRAEDFLNFALSKAGQAIAAELGHESLSQEVTKETLDALEVTYVPPPEADAKPALTNLVEQPVVETSVETAIEIGE